jgi:hypothetical protein
MSRETPPRRRAARTRDILAASLASGRDELWIPLLNVDRSSQRGAVSETEKREGRFVVDHSSI